MIVRRQGRHAIDLPDTLEGRLEDRPDAALVKPGTIYAIKDTDRIFVCRSVCGCLKWVEETQDAS
jgi:hypothetical protein